MRLRGKTAIVTGDASGFGEGIVRKFCAEGAEVMIADLNAEAADRLALELGALACKVDVSDAQEMAALSQAAESSPKWSSTTSSRSTAGRFTMRPGFSCPA